MNVHERRWPRETNPRKDFFVLACSSAAHPVKRETRVALDGADSPRRQTSAHGRKLWNLTVPLLLHDAAVIPYKHTCTARSKIAVGPQALYTVALGGGPVSLLLSHGEREETSSRLLTNGEEAISLSRTWAKGLRDNTLPRIAWRRRAALIEARTDRQFRH